MLPSFRWMCLALVVAGAPLRAQSTDAQRPTRILFERGRTLDGRLTETVWSQTDGLTTFTQRDPRQGEAISERTVVRFIGSPERLWIGSWAYDRDPTGIRRTQLRRDADLGADDNVSVMLSPTADKRMALFTINPNGALNDAEVLSFEGESREWDGIRDGRARVTEVGWQAETLTPWQTLRYRPIDADAAADAWDVNVRRYIRRKNESAIWSAWKRTEGIRFLERAGALIGFKEAVKVLEDGLPRRAFAEVRPYVFSSGALTERRVGADGALRATRDPGFRGTAGLDAKLAPTPTLSLDLTANADFAQAEVDRVAQADSISTSPTSSAIRTWCCLVPPQWTGATRRAIPTIMRAMLDFPNDITDIALWIDRVAQGFSPDMGFVQQHGITRTGWKTEFTPRPSALGRIGRPFTAMHVRQLKCDLLEGDLVRTRGNTSLLSGLSNGRLTTTPFGLEFESGDEFTVDLTRSFDAPQDAFDRFDGALIEAGRYAWNRAELDVRSSSARTLSLDAKISRGGFYSGRSSDLEFSVRGRFAPHVNVSMDYNRTSASLALVDSTVRFVAQTAPLRLDVATSPRLSTTLFAQWDNESNRGASNARVRWTSSPGSDLYLVWTSQWPTDLPNGLPWRTPARGTLVATYVKYFRVQETRA